MESNFGSLMPYLETAKAETKFGKRVSITYGPILASARPCKKPFSSPSSPSPFSWAIARTTVLPHMRRGKEMTSKSRMTSFPLFYQMQVYPISPPLPQISVPRSFSHHLHSFRCVWYVVLRAEGWLYKHYLSPEVPTQTGTKSDDSTRPRLRSACANQLWPPTSQWHYWVPR